MRMKLAVLLALALLGAGCPDDDGDDDDDDVVPPTDAGEDAQPGRDAGTDAGQDATTSPPDAGVDSGPPANPMDGLGDVETIDENHAFLEGPVWRVDQGVLLFSDIDADTIWQLDPPSTVTPFRVPSGRANGLAIDPDGLLLAAEHENRRVSRTLADGSVVTLVDSFEGARLNSPNDIAVRSDGIVYFTDPAFGVNWDLRELDFHGVFRVDADGGNLEALWRGDLESGPNGIGLSPDETLLYFGDAMGAVIHVMDVHPDGSADGVRPFVSTAEVPDGMAVDVWGNLWIATSEGVQVYGPDTTLHGTIPIPRVASNCAFGDDDGMTLYVTAEEGLYRVRTAVRGW